MIFCLSFFSQAAREGQEKTLGEVLENSVHSKKNYMTSGQPRPYLPNIKSRISSPPLAHRNFLAIRTVPSGKLVQGPKKVRGRPQSYIFCMSRLSILNQI